MVVIPACQLPDFALTHDHDATSRLTLLEDEHKQPGGQWWPRVRGRAAESPDGGHAVGPRGKSRARRENALDDSNHTTAPALPSRRKVDSRPGCPERKRCAESLFFQLEKSQLTI